MVLHKYGDRLYEGLKEVVNQHLKDVAEKVASANDLKFLDALNEAWSDHKISMLMIRDILMYMVIIEDRSFFFFEILNFCYLKNLLNNKNYD